MLSRCINHQVDCAIWDPIKLSPKRPELSHIFFADDLTLMAKANNKTCEAISTTFSMFCNLSGQKINYQKSKIIFSTNCPQPLQDKIANFLNISISKQFGKYLSFPITNKSPNHKDFLFILDNMRSKLANWKLNFLNLADRATLIQSTLSNIPNHVMQYFHLPKYTLKLIDRIQRNFLWGSTFEKQHLHLINWDIVTNPKELGGIGLVKSNIKNQALLANLT